MPNCRACRCRDKIATHSRFKTGLPKTESPAKAPYTLAPQAAPVMQPSPPAPMQNPVHATMDALASEMGIEKSPAEAYILGGEDAPEIARKRGGPVIRPPKAIARWSSSRWRRKQAAGREEVRLGLLRQEEGRARHARRAGAGTARHRAPRHRPDPAAAAR